MMIASIADLAVMRLLCGQNQVEVIFKNSYFFYSGFGFISFCLCRMPNLMEILIDILNLFWRFWNILKETTKFIFRFIIFMLVSFYEYVLLRWNLENYAFILDS